MGDQPADMLQRYRQRIAELETRLGQQATDLQFTRGLLGHYQQQADVDRWLSNPPPGEFVHALRSHTVGPFQPVWVTIGGHRLLVLVTGGGSDEGAEVAAWEWLQAHARSATPAFGIARAAMPARIDGVGYPDQAIVVSSGLCPELTRQAWRALRAGLRRQARAPGLRAVAALPLLAALRAMRYMLSPTMGAATTATAIMPLVTAAAISYGSATAAHAFPDLATPGHMPGITAVMPVSDPLPMPGSGFHDDRPDDHGNNDGQAEQGEEPPDVPPAPSAPSAPPSPAPAPSSSTPMPSPSPSPDATPTSAPSPAPTQPSATPTSDPKMAPAGPTESATPTPAPEPTPTQPPAGTSPAPADPVPAPEAPAPSGDTEVPAAPQAPEAPEEAPLTDDAATAPRPDEDPGPAPGTPGAVAALS